MNASDRIFPAVEQGFAIARSSIREACKAGYPGLIHFGGGIPLRLVLQKAITGVRLYLPDEEFLNLSSLNVELIDRRGTLPSYEASISSDHTDGKDAALSFMQGQAIHTKKEKLPWWNVKFSDPIGIERLTIQNRTGKWASRAYGLCVEWKNAHEDYHETFDNLDRHSINARAVAILAFVSQLSGQLEEEKTVSADAKHHVQAFASSVTRQLQLMQTVLTDRSSGLSEIFKARSAILECLRRAIASMSKDELLWFVRYSPVIEGLIWKGADRPIENIHEEVLAAQFVLAATYVEHQFVDLPKMLEFECLMDTKSKVETLESGMEALVERMGGNVKEFPLMIRVHGIRGSELRRDEQAFADAVVEIEELFSTLDMETAICYGTLLGIEREGRFIAHDDDVDVIFLAKSKSVGDIGQELNALVDQLNKRGVTSRIAEGFLFLKVLAPRANKFVDVFPLIDNPDQKSQLYMENMTIRSVDTHLLLPFGRVPFYGRTVNAPAKPAEFLAERYGESWRSPNRFYGMNWVRAES
jgi:hypothetical protein